MKDPSAITHPKKALQLVNKFVRQTCLLNFYCHFNKEWKLPQLCTVSRQCVRLDSSSVLDLGDSVGGLSDGQPDEAGGGQD